MRLPILAYHWDGGSCLSVFQTVIILTQESKKVEYISYFLGNHGNDCCFYERLNNLYRPESTADIHHCFSVKQMRMMLVLNGVITRIVIAVIVKIFGDSGGNEEILNINHIHLLFVHAKNDCWRFYCFESQQSCDSDHTDSCDMDEDRTQDLSFNSSFIIHPRLAQASQKI